MGTPVQGRPPASCGRGNSGKRRPVASQVKSGCVMTPTGFPPGATRKARPANAARVPSVAMMGLTLSLVTMRPLMTPSPTPVRMPMTIASCIEPCTNGMGSSSSPSTGTCTTSEPRTIADAAVTDATEAMEPTEISSMPATMTTVSPTASRPTMTIDWLRLFMRFCQLRNSGWAQTIRTTMKIRAPMSEMLSTPTALMMRRNVLTSSSPAGGALGPAPLPPPLAAAGLVRISLIPSPLRPLLPRRLPG